MENFSVTILGSSSASPTANRNTSGQLINYSNRLYLIDCGEGTQIQLRRNKIKFSRIHHIMISHLHGDHFFGLVGLISSFNLFGRVKDLHIYSDPRIQDIIQQQLDVSETELRFKIIYHPLNFNEKAVMFEDKKLKISSFPLEHRIPTCGFIFQEKQSLPNIKKQAITKYKLSIDQIKEIRNGSDLVELDGNIIAHQEITTPSYEPRSYAYCSDTKYFEGLSENLENVELLYSECTFMKDLQNAAIDKFHLTTVDAANLAHESKAKRLIVGHFSARYKDLTDFKNELQALCSCADLIEENKTYNIREE